ncbi:MAG TPA: hypothetical protein VH188_12305 [Chthoniobacterales bacterium]|jgi:hypothetical protein|nr:hypothetical protein [Chthoniobacterales bacterium]
MPSPPPTDDLLDLRMLPAWVNEPARPNDYSNFEGEEAEPAGRRPDRPRNRDRERRGPRTADRRKERPGRDRDRGPRRPHDATRDHGPSRERRPQVEPEPLAVNVRFLPHQKAFDNVIAQIKSASIAYSVFALARLFLEKPERYDVRLTLPEGTQPATPESRDGGTKGGLFQLGENGAVAADRRILENSAFASARDDFYTVEVTQNEPMKGNFTNVARCRLSGTLLGPTNYHAYQPQLRNLYESRFSRRMSFADYQRQIDIVSDPAVVDQWKEQARNVTTYHVKNAEPPQSFTNSADAERHFRQNYLPALLREANELTISGVLSRRLPDRRLGRAIENAWAQETRSPSKMMQELAAGLRQAGLNIFRHRRGMLFVSPVRARVFGHERAGVSASINAILEKVAATPGINRKQLAEQLQLAPADADAAAAERAKMTLVNDLHWLVREGYVIEFNDGSLDLPRAKPPAPAAEEKPAAPEEPIASHAERSETKSTDAVATDQPEPITAESEPVSNAEPKATETPVSADSPA